MNQKTKVKVLIIGGRKMSDLEKAIDGDKEAFSRVIIKNKEAMYKTAIIILRNEDDAYDALQNALIKMYKNISNLENKEAFNACSRRIIINCCYDLINKNKKVIDITSRLTLPASTQPCWWSV